MGAAMAFQSLPTTNRGSVSIPPIKCQGIKTKLVPFITASLQWNGRGRWIEPFLGSGVVLFNVQPERAIANDINPHIIALYQRIYSGALTSDMVEEHLTREGKQLLIKGEDHYYTVRDRFNRTHESLDFLFLNRSCFNGVMRFNSKGGFNVPFCRKPDRFRQAYVTKIVNQVKAIQKIMRDKDWKFQVGDWRTCPEKIRAGDFVYLDPPYIGRHTDYYDQWSESDAIELADTARALPCGFALSMWKENKYRTNTHLIDQWSGLIERTITHFYHVGSTEDLRNSMEEALLIKPGYEADVYRPKEKIQVAQLSLALSERRKAYKSKETH